MLNGILFDISVLLALRSADGMALIWSGISLHNAPLRYALCLSDASAINGCGRSCLLYVPTGLPCLWVSGKGHSCPPPELTKGVPPCPYVLTAVSRYRQRFTSLTLSPNSPTPQGTPWVSGLGPRLCRPYNCVRTRFTVILFTKECLHSFVASRCQGCMHSISSPLAYPLQVVDDVVSFGVYIVCPTPGYSILYIGCT